MSVYTWIRESVKRAVLLGVSDAVEQMGGPTESDEGTQRLLTMLRQPPALDVAPQGAVAAMTGPVASGTSTGTTGRTRRLGKSLDQIRQSGLNAGE